MKSVLTLPADNCTVATIHEETLVDGHEIEAIGEQLLQAATESNYRLVVNFGHVERCSSSVLGKLLVLRRVINKQHGRLVLCCCGEQMMQALRITGLRVLFDVLPDEAEAIEYMRHDAVAFWREDK